jgi:hypothetical protein
MRKVGLAVAAVIGLAVIGLGVMVYLQRPGRAQFQAAAAPISVDLPMCKEILTTEPYGIGADAADRICQSASPSTWFTVAISNMGNRTGWVTHCRIDVRRPDGTLQTQVYLLANVEPVFHPAGFPIDPGKEVRLVWYPGERGWSADLAVPVNTYVATCQPVVYKGPVPI